jgi:hypothetical protein
VRGGLSFADVAYRGFGDVAYRGFGDVAYRGFGDVNVRGSSRCLPNHPLTLPVERPILAEIDFVLDRSRQGVGLVAPSRAAMPIAGTRTHRGVPLACGPVRNSFRVLRTRLRGSGGRENARARAKLRTGKKPGEETMMPMNQGKPTNQGKKVIERGALRGTPDCDEGFERNPNPHGSPLGKPHVGRSEATEHSEPFDWKRAHNELVRLASDHARLEWELGRWLLRALRAATPLRLGYASMAEYAHRLFGFDGRFTSEKLRVAETLEELPALSRALGRESSPGRPCAS